MQCQCRSARARGINLYEHPGTETDKPGQSAEGSATNSEEREQARSGRKTVARSAHYAVGVMLCFDFCGRGKLTEKGGPHGHA